MAFTLRSVNSFIKSPARSRSLPARNPFRLRTFAASFGLNPSCSRASAQRLMIFGSMGGLAGATMPTVSPKFKRAGRVGMECLRGLFFPQRKQLVFGLVEDGFEFA